MVANLLYGLIPGFVVPVLFMRENSIFMIVFIRFLVAGTILFVFIIIQLLIGNRHGKVGKDSFFKATAGDIWAYLRSRNARFLNAPRMVYIYILAFFGVGLNVVTYLIGLEKLSINLQLVGGPGGAIIVVSLYNLAKGHERITLFKAIYLFMMFLSLGLVVVATESATSTKATPTGLIALGLNLLSLFILFVYMSRDAPSPDERSWGEQKHSNLALMRLLVKLVLFMVLGAGSILLFAIVGMLVPGTYLHVLSTAFFKQLPDAWWFVIQPHMLGLSIVSTAVAYLCLFLPAAFWDTEHSLSLDQWNSILYLLDPIFGTSISMLLGFEDVDTVLMVVTLAILVVAILLRFVHERESKFNAIIWINITFGKQREVLQMLSRFDEIRKYYWLAGQADAMIKATFGTMREYHRFLAMLGLEKTIKIKFDMLSFVNKVV